MVPTIGAAALSSDHYQPVVIGPIVRCRRPASASQSPFDETSFIEPVTGNIKNNLSLSAFPMALHIGALRLRRIA
jgi:hypothetical protein